MGQPPRLPPQEIPIDYRVALIERDVAVNGESVKNLDAEMDRKVSRDEFLPVKEKQKEFVTKAEFWPVKTLVYGVAAPALLGIVAAIAKLVFK